MELAERIRTRRSVQVYEDRPVPAELVEELIDAAVWAPNHHLTQPWRFILVQGEGRRRIAEARRQFAESEPGEPERRKQRGEQQYAITMGVPAFLVVVMAEDPRPLIRDEDLIATSCVVQNLLLLAEDRGLGVAVKSYGATFHPAFREGLGIRPGERVVVTLQLGYASRQPNSRPRASARERMTVLDGARAAEA